MRLSVLPYRTKAVRSIDAKVRPGFGGFPFTTGMGYPCCNARVALAAQFDWG